MLGRRPRAHAARKHVHRVLDLVDETPITMDAVVAAVSKLRRQEIRIIEVDSLPARTPARAQVVGDMIVIELQRGHPDYARNLGHELGHAVFGHLDVDDLSPALRGLSPYVSRSAITAQMDLPVRQCRADGATDLDEVDAETFSLILIAELDRSRGALDPRAQRRLGQALG